MWPVFLRSLSFALATAMCGNLMNRHRSAHWCVVASGSWLLCCLCILLILALFFIVFEQCLLFSVNKKAEVILFHLINLFAHLLPNTCDSAFLCSMKPLIILQLPSVAGMFSPLTVPSSILWEPRLDVLFSNSQLVLHRYKSVHFSISHYVSNASMPYLPRDMARLQITIPAWGSFL